MMTCIPVTFFLMGLKTGNAMTVGWAALLSDGISDSRLFYSLKRILTSMQTIPADGEVG